jgi:hypothetical protein
VARPAYSALLAKQASISDPTDLGGPPAGSLWVVRFIAMTVGSFLGFIAGGVSVDNEDPWLYVVSNSTTKLFGDHAQTFYWEGRIVVPNGSHLWARVEDGDTGDFYVSGYVLSVSGD